MKKILIVWLGLVVTALMAADNAVPPKPYGAVPSAAQLRWHEDEIISLVHFSTIIYADKEWGYGVEPAALFNPTECVCLEPEASRREAGKALANAIETGLAKTGWEVVSASCKGEGELVGNAIDGNPRSQWSTHDREGHHSPPQEVVVDMGESHELSGFLYLPRQDSITAGNVDRYAFYVSADGKVWGNPAAQGGEPTPFNSDPSNLLNFQDEQSRKAAAEELQRLGKIKCPSRSSYFGIVDLCGFKKDRFYIYQARRRPELPMAHILPHWNWPERIGQVTPVHGYSSGDGVALFLNGTSLGRKKKGQHEYRLRWNDVVYAPGALRAVAYKDGKPWAKDEVTTTGSAAKLTVDADRAAIAADRRDLSFVTVTVADKEGRLVPRSKNLVHFNLSGPGEIVAADNGDATSLEPFITRQMKAYNGLCLAIVRATGTGAITLTASADGLADAKVVVTGN